MSTTYYRPKRKADLIRHLREDHPRDHVGTPTEVRAIYNIGWTVAVLTERHDMFHAERNPEEAR